MHSRIVVFLAIFTFNTGFFYGQNLSNQKKVSLSIVNSVNSSDRSLVNLRVLINNPDKLENIIEPEDILNQTRLNDSLYVLDLKCEKNKLIELTAQDRVIFIDRFLSKPVIEGFLINFDPTLNTISSVQSRYNSIDGTGIKVSIREDPFNHYDIDFKGRTDSTFLNEYWSPHATDMATIVAGAGNKSIDSKGVAPGAFIFTSPLIDLLPTDSQELLKKEISVQNHSYGTGTNEGYYGIESYSFDLQAYELPYFISVFSSGNNGLETPTRGKYLGIKGFSNLTGQMKVSKNTISVGASDSFGKVQEISSSGPTEDGRIKPEIIAYGSNGTSEAAALVSGTIVLLQNAYKTQNDDIPNSSLIKALLINGAENKGGLPSHKEGFGNMNALESIETVLAGNYFEGEIINQEEKKYQILVPDNATKLSITLCWTDPPASFEVKNALVNDLDISLMKKGSTREWLPWTLNSFPSRDSLLSKAVRAIDTLNNFEKISLDNISEGEYTISIKGKDVRKGPQSYSLVYSFDNPSRWMYPTKSNFLEGGKEVILRWECQTSGKGILEYRNIAKPSSNWEIITENINLIDEQYLWEPPNENGLFKLRVRGDVEIESGIFAISTFNDFKIEFNCNGNSKISWESNDEIDSYNVYMLGERYMELISSTRDTVFDFDFLPENSNNICVAPVINSIEIGRTTAQLVSPDIPCYFQNIFSGIRVSDYSSIIVQLHTNIDIESIRLEKFSNNSYEIIEERINDGSLEYKFEDFNVQVGANNYRSSILTKSGEVYYSDSVETFILKKDMAYLYPVPARSGELMEVATPYSEKINIKVFNANGKLVLEQELKGVVKQLDTSYLKSGMYFVLIDSNNNIIYKKIIII